VKLRADVFFPFLLACMTACRILALDVQPTAEACKGTTQAAYKDITTPSPELDEFTKMGGKIHVGCLKRPSDWKINGREVIEELRK
jgi:hypothetical protein